ncbi:MAG: hypothetical protein R3E79_37145 [Caldilineaceae bacterium]
MKPHAPAKGCIALENYVHPPEPASEVVRNGLHTFEQRLRHALGAPTDDQTVQQQNLRAAPLILLERIVPEPVWTSFYLEPVQAALTNWLAADTATAGAQLFVSAPHSTLYASIKAWANREAWQILEPPTPDEILADDGRWLERWHDRNQGRWLLPPLERCYLRHHNGLNLIRRLLEIVRLQQPTCLLVCSSWAWAYLDQALHVRSVLPTPLTLPPFDAYDLNHWLACLPPTAVRGDLVFREADSGEAIFWAEETGTDQAEAANGVESAPDNGRSALGRTAAWLGAALADGWVALQKWGYRAWYGRPNAQAHSQFLKHLAARSRGTPKVAWAIWRHSLQVVADEVEHNVQVTAAEDSRRTIWVRPWEELALPTVMPDADVRQALVLHALLLHNGLPDVLLPEVLPLRSSEIVYCLRQLEKAGLVVRQGGVWQTTPLGYPAVRGFLASENFLLDGL